MRTLFARAVSWVLPCSPLVPAGCSGEAELNLQLNYALCCEETPKKLRYKVLHSWYISSIGVEI